MRRLNRPLETDLFIRSFKLTLNFARSPAIQLLSPLILQFLQEELWIKMLAPSFSQKPSLHMKK